MVAPVDCEFADWREASARIEILRPWPASRDLAVETNAAGRVKNRRATRRF
jgi:hypothetical protein